MVCVQFCVCACSSVYVCISVYAYAVLCMQFCVCVRMCVQFCEQLRQPLCLALLRNCMSPYDEAFAAATKLFTAVLVQPQLRGGLKAELGAFFPLLLLRPLEADK